MEECTFNEVLGRFLKGYEARFRCRGSYGSSSSGFDPVSKFENAYRVEHLNRLTKLASIPKPNYLFCDRTSGLHNHFCKLEFEDDII